MNISPHFTLAEYTRSATAAKLGIDNTPPAPLLTGEGTVRMLFLRVMEPIRTLLGVSLNITSGYRCPALNLAIGGAVNSDHQADQFGAACDFVPDGMDMQEAFDKIRCSEIPFDQLILEHKGDDERPKCIHVGWRPDSRRMAGIAQTHSRGKVERWLEVGAPIDA